MAEENKTYEEELKKLSDEELEMLSQSAPGMTNIHIIAEAKRRKKEKQEKGQGKTILTGGGR